MTEPELFDYDEFGAAAQGQADQRYGWLGGKQRSSETLAGPILMGVRLYSPIIGRFLTVDPVKGGSCNAYEYACQDPVNSFDLDGRAKCKGFWKCTTSWLDKHAGTITAVATVVALLPIPSVSQVAGAVAIAGSAYSTLRAYQKRDAYGVATGLLGVVPGVGALAKSAKVYKALTSTKGLRCRSCGQRGIGSQTRAFVRTYHKSVRSYRRWMALAGLPPRTAPATTFDRSARTGMVLILEE